MDFPQKNESSATLTHIDRRAFPRYTVHVQIELHEEGDDVPIRAETTDLSRGGCYVQLMMTLPLAAYVNATLWLDDIPVHVRGRVVTRHPQFGNGIMFLEFKERGEEVLARYLDGISDAS